MTAIQVFFKTLAALMVGPLLAVMGQLAIANPNYRTALLVLVLGALAGVIGALVAALHALTKGVAVTPWQKAVRALFQGIAQVLSGIVINTWADVTTLPKLLLPLVIGVVISTAITYLQNVAPAPSVPA